MTTTAVRTAAAERTDLGGVGVLGAGQVTAAVLALADMPVLCLVALAVLMLWGMDEAADRRPERRALGYATTIISLGSFLAVALPLFLPPARDQLLLVLVLASVLVWSLAAAPSLRDLLGLRLPTNADYAWFTAGFLATLAVSLHLAGVEGRLVPANGALLVFLVLFPFVHEVLYRGLLMRVTGTSLAAVASVALVQGLGAVPAFGIDGFLAMAALGAACGLVRRLLKSWITGLAAQWGIVLGIVAPVLTLPGVVA